MPTEKKKNQVKELEDLFRDNKFFISTEYKNISANQMTNLRKVLNSSGSSFRVIKNNLAFCSNKFKDILLWFYPISTYCVEF